MCGVRCNETRQTAKCGASVNTSDLDDLAPVIGYRATRVIVAWFAGRRLHVPAKAAPDHPLATLLGPTAFGALVRQFAGCRLLIPTEGDEMRYKRDRNVAELIAAGWALPRVADHVGLSVRRVEQIRAEVVRNGWLEYAKGFDADRRYNRGRRELGAAALVVGPAANFGTGESSDEYPPTSAEFSGMGEVSGDSPPPGAPDSVNPHVRAA